MMGMELPPPLELVYSCRPSLIEKERRWVLRADELSWTAEGFSDQTPLQEISEIRLQYAPTRYVAQMFRCRIRMRNGKVWHMQNHHFAGMANFEDRSVGYKDLIENLVSRVASQNPQCAMISGSSWANWIFSSLFLCGSLLLLLVVMFYMWTAIGWLVIVKLLLILFFLPRAFLWISRNKPSRFDSQKIPADLLPK